MNKYRISFANSPQRSPDIPDIVEAYDFMVKEECVLFYEGAIDEPRFVALYPLKDIREIKIVEYK